MFQRIPRAVGLAALAALSVWLSFPGSVPCSPAAQSDGADRLEGTWRYRSTEVAGESVPGPDSFHYVFRGGKAVFRVDDREAAEGTYRVDWSHQPAHIDFVQKTKKGETLHRGILEVKGDTIRWCSTMQDDGPRPTAFATRQGDHNKLRVLFRIPESVPAPLTPPADAAANSSDQGTPGNGTTAAEPAPTAPLAPPKRFKLTLLETPEGRTSMAVEINGRGQVVGELDQREAKRPCLWTDGKLDLLPAFDRPAATVYGINDKGVLAGTHVLGERGTPYLYENGQLFELPSDVKYPLLLAYGLNSRRQVVGVAFHPMSVTSAWLWENGKTRALGTLGGYCSEAMAVNERGQVAGYSNLRDYGPQHASLWDNGRLQDLGTLGGPESKGYDLNDSGQVVGVSESANGQDRAFLWSAGRMQNLGVLPGGRSSWAWSINNSGLVAGWSLTSAGKQHAVFWYQGDFRDLNDMVPDLQGWTLVVARAVNNRGWIAGTATRGGQRRAFLLEPVFDTVSKT